MNYVIFDLEWNRDCERVNKICADEIIEIGAVKIDMDTGKQAEFHSYVKPSIYRKLNKYVKKMTGITEDVLTLGEEFLFVLDEFKKFAGDNCVFMSWSRDDLPILKNNSLFYNKFEEFAYFKAYVDLQQYFVKTMQIETKQISLAKAADLLKIEYEEETLHCAITDALLSAEIFKKIYSEITIQDFFSLSAMQETDITCKHPKARKGQSLPITV